MDITSKEQYLAHLNSLESENAKIIISEIEAEIRKALTNGRRLPISIKNKWSGVLDVVKEHYESQGWEFEYSSDQRESDYIRLS
jgi:hypothetical protein